MAAGAGGYPPAERGVLERLREVAQRERVLAQLLLEPRPGRAGLDPRRPRSGVHLQHPVEALREMRRVATAAGIVVIVSAGNAGKDENGTPILGGISSPGNSPHAITVGASNSFGTNVRTDDVITTYSSRGPTRSFWTDESGVKHYDNQLKPELAAPGNKTIFAQSPNNYLVTQNPALNANVSASPTRNRRSGSFTVICEPSRTPGIDPTRSQAVARRSTLPRGEQDPEDYEVHALPHSGTGQLPAHERGMV